MLIILVHRHNPILMHRAKPDLNLLVYSSQKTDKNRFIIAFVPTANTNPLDQVFANTGQPLVREFIAGKNCLLFAYGNTNAGLPLSFPTTHNSFALLGKTFTVNGSDAEPGVLPRILEMVFLQLSELAKDTQYEYHVLANYLEIYNETIIDLLPAEKDEKAVLEIKEDKAGVIFVTGLKEERLQSPEDGRRLLQVGQQNR